MSSATQKVRFFYVPPSWRFPPCSGTVVQPSLATSCDPNAEGTVWTCKLREGVTFHDGSTFEAKDVILSFAVQWDAAHPLHKGNTGIFEYWGGLWGGNLNPPPPAT